MMSSGNTTVAVSEFKYGGMTTEHYKSRLDAVEGILLSSGEDGFAAFMTETLPRIEKRWADSAERDSKLEALHEAIKVCPKCQAAPDEDVLCDEHSYEED